MVDTAGTLTKAADLMMEKGALSVRAICTHPILSGNAYEKIRKFKIRRINRNRFNSFKTTNSKIRVLSCAEFICRCNA